MNKDLDQNHKYFLDIHLRESFSGKLFRKNPGYLFLFFFYLSALYFYSNKILAGQIILKGLFALLKQPTY
jgi:hypothetical protein